MIKVTEGNSLVLTNICYGYGEITVVNINRSQIALSTINGIEVYNKDTQQLIYSIP